MVGPRIRSCARRTQSEMAMSIGSKQGPVASETGARAEIRAGILLGGLAAVLLVGVIDAVAQENACASPDPRQACSYQCCGRRSCPPSCEVDCVKLCVDACGSQTRSLAYDSRKRDLQLRCGNKGAR